MAKFVDCLGREWELPPAVSVRRPPGLGGDLPQPGQPTPQGKEALGRLLWSLVQGQALACGVDEESFAGGLDDAALGRAREALLVAAGDFERNPARVCDPSLAAADSKGAFGAQDYRQVLAFGPSHGRIVDGAQEGKGQQ
jgi:hypothetical protein